MDSPFECGGDVQTLDAIPQGFKLVIRVAKVDSVQVNLKKNGTPSADAADYFLVGGDALEIAQDNVKLSCLNVTGDPKIYWTLEPR